MSQCIVCSKPSTVKCSNCDVSYCNDNCIDTHWTQHQYECIGGKRDRADDAIVTLQFKDGSREVPVSSLEPFETLYNLLEDTNDNVLPVPNVLAADFDELYGFKRIYQVDIKILPRIIIAANYLGDTEFIKIGMSRIVSLLFNSSMIYIRDLFGIHYTKFSKEQLEAAKDLTIVPVFDYVLTEVEQSTFVGIPNDLFIEYVFSQMDPHKVIQLRELHVRFWNVTNRYVIQKMREELPEIAFASDATLIGIALEDRLDNRADVNGPETYLLTRDEWFNVGGRHAQFRHIAIDVIKKWGSFYNLGLEKARREKTRLENVQQLEEFLRVEYGYLRPEDLIKITWKYTLEYRKWDEWVDWIEHPNTVISASSLMVKKIVKMYQFYIRDHLDHRRFNEMSDYLTNETFARIISAEYLGK